MIALDTETTGLDHWHGARPYFVTTCDEEGRQRWWEWDVDPLTRGVTVPEEDAKEIWRLVASQDRIVGQNIKFDAHALTVSCVVDWSPLWAKTHDTLIAGHLLASNQQHDLTSMVLQYLGEDIEPCERALEKAVKEARSWCRKHQPSWAIAQRGREDMPSTREKSWKLDAWLPKTLRRLEGVGDESWDAVLAEYANTDSAATMALWRVMEVEVKRRGLWDIYLEQRQLAEVLWGMEQRGVTYHLPRAEEIRRSCQEGLRKTREDMLRIARGRTVECDCLGMPTGCQWCGGTGRRPFELELPKSGANDSLRRFVFEVLKLPVVLKTEKGSPSLSQDAFPLWKVGLEDGSVELEFLESLESDKAHSKSLEALDRYQRYAIPTGDPGCAVLHPSINQTAADTLRTSSSNPNSQNVGTEADEFGVSLRSPFGPAPGREWWAMDYANIELRIPAYVSGEQELIALFERPDEPPYFGSEHLLNFHTVYPDWWEAALAEVGGDISRVGDHIKNHPRWKPRYKRCKNGDFATGYGAGNRKADATFGREGSRAKLISRFQKKEKLNQQKISEANRRGFVETIPDREISPLQGYPILTSRSEWGRVSPTVPLNYWCQSTACWVARRALVACERQLREWREKGFDAWMCLYVHDEIVFDFPRGGRRNLPRVIKLVRIMESMGDAIGVPLKAEWKYCPRDWATSEEPR